MANGKANKETGSQSPNKNDLLLGPLRKTRQFIDGMREYIMKHHREKLFALMETALLVFPIIVLLLKFAFPVPVRLTWVNSSPVILFDRLKSVPELKSKLRIFMSLRLMPSILTKLSAFNASESVIFILRVLDELLVPNATRLNARLDTEDV